MRKDGRIYRGRPEWAMGAHCLGHNDWLGVCAEGNYQVTQSMPPAQLHALQWLHDDIKRRRPGLPDKRHKDMPGNSTACPGVYFAFARIVAGYDPLVAVKVRRSLWTAFKAWREKRRAA